MSLAVFNGHVMMKHLKADNLNRGMSSSLNWLSVFIFSFFTLLIWIGWIVSLLSFPESLYGRLYDASGNYDFNFSFFKFLVAFLFTGYWIFSIITSKITNRSMVTNWAIGITMIWITFICLWGDAVNNRKSYKTVFPRGLSSSTRISGSQEMRAPGLSARNMSMTVSMG